MRAATVVLAAVLRHGCSTYQVDVVTGLEQSWLPLWRRPHLPTITWRAQRSFRHPNEYYTAGHEPDGVWFNPKGLFTLADGGKVDSSEFHRLCVTASQRYTSRQGHTKRGRRCRRPAHGRRHVLQLRSRASRPCGPSTDPELRSEIERAQNRCGSGSAGGNSAEALRPIRVSVTSGRHRNRGASRRYSSGDVPTWNQAGQLPGYCISHCVIVLPFAVCSTPGRLTATRSSYTSTRSTPGSTSTGSSPPSMTSHGRLKEAYMLFASNTYEKYL